MSTTLNPLLIPGSVVQAVYSELTSVLSVTAVIPLDDTIPQASEGAEVITVSITPKSATNYLLVEAVLNASCPVGGYKVSAALFRDSVLDSIAANWWYQDGPEGQTGQHFIRRRILAGSTTTTVFKVRIGAQAAGVLYVNGLAGARNFGGVCMTSIMVTEVAA